jgi:hypothetical protein
MSKVSAKSEKSASELLFATIARAFAATRDPVEVVWILAQEAAKTGDVHWEQVLKKVPSAVLAILSGIGAGEVFECGAEDHRLGGHGFASQLGSSLACVIVAIEEGEDPVRAIKLGSYAPGVEISVLAALVGAHHWQLERFSPAWQATIRRHLDPPHSTEPSPEVQIAATNTERS